MRELIVAIEGVTAAEADQMADSLERALLALGEADQVARIRDPGARTQDFGVAVSVILGAPAVVVIARGLRDWIAAQNKGEVVIKTKTGNVVLRGAAARKVDVAEIIAALNGERE